MHNTSAKQPGFWRITLVAGLLAGSLDIIAAAIQYYINTGKGPEPVFRYIASGVFGARAFTQGSQMMAWGMLFHFLIAGFFAALFIGLYRSLPFIRPQVILWGLLYGIIVWLVMNKLVVPLSNAPALPFDWQKAIIGMIILMLMIGLPVALVCKYYDQPVISNRGS